MWIERGEGFGCYLERDGFFISYNPMEALNMCMGFFASDDGQPETALCIDEVYYVLNGDFRKEYEAFGNDKEACFNFYKSKKAKYASSWDQV